MGELARHWIAATRPIDLAKAIRYSRQAADAALGALAPADALQYYAQALDLYSQLSDPDPAIGIDLTIGLGTAQRQTGDAAYRDTLVDAARWAIDLGETDRLVGAALANNRGWFSDAGAVDADKVDILELALDRLPADHPRRALVLATLCSELTHGSALERRRALADEAVAIAGSSGDDAEIVRVLNTVFLSLALPSLLDQSLARTADALARAERVGDPVLLFWAAMWRSVAAERTGDSAEMDRCDEIMASLAERLSQPTITWCYCFMRVPRALIAGDTHRAEQFATEALQAGTDSGQPDTNVFFGAHVASMSWQRGP